MAEDQVIVFADAKVTEGKKGFLAAQSGVVAVALPTETIKANLKNFLASLDQMLPDKEPPKTGYLLESFEVAVSIDATGKVGFLGTGAEVGGSATLTLSFKKP